MSQIQVPPHLVPIIQAAANATGIPFNVLAAKLAQESRFNPNARGAAGEIGIAQVMPSTAARPGYGLPPIELAALNDPAQAIPWGANYLAARSRSAGVRDWNDPAQAARGLAAYNGRGPAADAYGRQVAQMAGLVQPPGPPTADSGDAPLRGAPRMSKPEDPGLLAPPELTYEQEMVRRVQEALRFANQFTGAP